MLVTTDRVDEAVAVRRVGLRPLPPPDRLDVAWDSRAVCAIVAGDVTVATTLGRELVAAGWRVVLLTAGGTATSTDLPTMDVDWTRHDAYPELLDAIGERVGPIAGVVDVQGADRGASDDLLGHDAEEAHLLSLFLLAKHLSPRLTSPDRPGFLFAVVTRIDGALGLGASATATGVVTAGVYGLVKTLRHEWPSAFCRAIDVHPDLPVDAAAAAIVSELHDPDRTLPEVGVGPAGRCTVAAFDEADG